MVCIRVVGGSLSDKRLKIAAQRHACGDAADAIAIYRDILKDNPQNHEALLMMGIIAHQRGNNVLSLELIDASIAVDSNHAPAWVNRAILLRIFNRDAEALVAARRATKAAPTLADAWDLTGQLLTRAQRYAEAATCHARAVELAPENAAFLANYAAHFFAQGALESAYLCAKQACELDTRYPPVMLANILKAMGHCDEAATEFARASALCGSEETSASEAMALLQIGDYAHGWKAWEKRPDFDRALFAIPLWQGEECQSLLVHEDQGLGDALQFLRYLPLLSPRVHQLTVRVRSPLVRLCRDTFPAFTIISDEDEAFFQNMNPPPQTRCRLSSLPFFFDTRLTSIPPPPYLVTSNLENRALALPQMAVLATPRIGIAWAGNQHFRADAARSIGWNTLQPLFAGLDAHFVSLQKDLRPQDVLTHQKNIVDVAPALVDFADTAAVISTLDLVISVDTALAHLAGALGKPAFVLLPFDSDWRWLLGREDSPWYPSLRLFRQKVPGQWADVLDAVNRDVQMFVSGNREVLKAKTFSGDCLRKNPYALALPSLKKP